MIWWIMLFRYGENIYRIVKLLNVAFHHTRKLETQSLSAGSLLIYYDGFDHTLHWFLSGLLSCLACCFSVDHRRGGGGLKMQVGEITLLPLLDYLPTIGLSYSLIDIIKMIYCSTEANMSDNYFVTQQWRWAFSSQNRKCKFITL